MQIVLDNGLTAEIQFIPSDILPVYGTVIGAVAP
jgi:hypothetical protein